jgi:hypothetical protein
MAHQKNQGVTVPAVALFSFRVHGGCKFSFPQAVDQEGHLGILVLRRSRSHIDVLPVELFPVLPFLVAIRSGLRALRQIACLHRLPAIVFGGTSNIFRILGGIDLRPLSRYGSPIQCRPVGKMSYYAHPGPRTRRFRCHEGKNPKDNQRDTESLHFPLLDLRSRRQRTTSAREPGMKCFTTGV